MSETTRIADALVLCMTRGMSLAAWKTSGVLEREWAIYERLKPHYGTIIVFSYGGADDRAVAKSLGVELVCRNEGEAVDAYVGRAASAVHATLERLGATSCVIKTNQFEGGDAAVAITRGLRTVGHCVALLARGGYHWSHFEALKHGPTSTQALRAAGEESDLLRAADHIVCTTKETQSLIAYRHQLPLDRVHVVPNFVLDSVFDAPQIARADGDDAVLLSAGRLEPQKRFYLLLNNVGRVSVLHDTTFKVRVVGKGPEHDSLMHLAKLEQVNLDLVGSLDHAALLREMAACTVYIQCSAFEGHPKAVIEAMATGAPVVVTNDPGLGGLIEHEQTGLVCHEQSIGHAVKRLLNDEPLRRRLGEGARKFAHWNYRLSNVAQSEIAAHRYAVWQSQHPDNRVHVPGAVRWDPALLHASRTEQTEAWRQSINGFARRLPPRERAAFLLSLDDPIYQLQGPAAIEVEQQPGGSPGGIHPKHRLMRYHDFFVERIKPGERVIDLGSGVGALAASIASRCNAGVTGLELEPANIAKANAIAAQQSIAGRVKYTLGDITTHRAEGVFDVVVLSNVLEHIKNRPAMLRQWAQWYSPSRFLIRVPAFDRDWKVPFKKELGVEWRLDDTHELEYTAETLESELREAGLEITETIVRWGEYWVSARPSPSREVWASIRMLVFDFDGVMSNNQVLVMQDGTEGVLCNRSDGLGIEMLRKAAAARDAAAGAGQPPFSMLVLSKEVNPVVAARCKKLKLECHQGVDDKLPHLRRLAGERGVTRGQVAYVGNDVNDVACMQWAGLPIAVNDAFPACKAAARAVTNAPGGHGAVREVCERIVAAWDS